MFYRVDVKPISGKQLVLYDTYDISYNDNGLYAPVVTNRK